MTLPTTAEAFRLAMAAENAWEKLLDAYGVERWSNAAGESDDISVILNTAFEAKKAADRILGDCFARDRAADSYTPRGQTSLVQPKRPPSRRL